MRYLTTYYSNQVTVTPLEEAHLTRVAAAEGQFVDSTYVAEAVALLRRLKLLPHLVHWTDARFGVTTAGGQITRLFSLQGADAVAIPGVAGPQYVPKGYNKRPEILYNKASLRVPEVDLSRTDQYTIAFLGQQRQYDTIGFFYELSEDFNQPQGGLCALIENNQLEISHRTSDYVFLRDTNTYRQQPLYVVTRGDFTRSSREINVRMNALELTEYSYAGTPYDRDTTGRLQPDALFLGARGGVQHPLRYGMLNSLLILDVAVSDAVREELLQFLQQQYAVPVSAEVPQDGLVLRLQADRAVHFDSDGKLLRWEDQSGNALDVIPIQGSARLSPDRLNGHPMLRVSGPVGTVRTSGIRGNTPRSVYLLGRLVTGNVIVSCGTPEGGQLCEWMQLRGNPLLHAYGGGMDSGYPLPEQPVNAPALWEWRYDGQVGVHCDFNDQRGPLTKLAAVVDTADTPLYLAWGPYYGNSTLDVLEVMVYNRLVSGDEDEQIRAYLSRKGGIPVQTNGNEVVPTQQLQGWWQADKGVSLDGNGVVEQWADQSSHARHLIPESPSASLTVEEWAGQKAIRFDGLQTFMPSTVGSTEPTVYTVVLVLQKQTGHSNMMPIAFGQDTSTANDLWANYGCFGLNNFNDNIYGVPNDRFLDNPVLITAEIHSNNSFAFRLWINGEAQSVSAVINPTVNRPLDAVFRIGGSVFRNSGSYLWNGWLGEIMLYDRVLTEQERKQIDTMLIGKYKL